MSNIKLVVGLGNPGDEYSFTRHNCGFMVVDELADRLGVSYWKSQDGCSVGVAKASSLNRKSGSADDGDLVLVKPQAFMNCSGGPVAHVMKRYGVKPSEILVIHDDLDLAAGKVRVKEGGGHGGHNGVRSIVNSIGKDFPRLRMGIGRPPGKMDPADFVLAKVRKGQADDLMALVYLGADVAQIAISEGLAKAMSKYGGK